MLEDNAVTVLLHWLGYHHRPAEFLIGIGRYGDKYIATKNAQQLARVATVRSFIAKETGLHQKLTTILSAPTYCYTIRQLL